MSTFLRHIDLIQLGLHTIMKRKTSEQMIPLMHQEVMTNSTGYDRLSLFSHHSEGEPCNT
jgi:hypothetical protein